MRCATMHSITNIIEERKEYFQHERPKRVGAGESPMPDGETNGSVRYDPIRIGGVGVVGVFHRYQKSAYRFGRT